MVELKESNADVLCLQELDHVEDFYRPGLDELGYTLLFSARPGFYRGEGVAIAFKKDKFNMIAHEIVDMDDLVKVYPQGSVFRRGNQGMFALLEHKTSGNRIVAGCAHLFFNPQLDFVKQAQALYLMERSAAFLKSQGRNLPIFIGGDFNS